MKSCVFFVLCILAFVSPQDVGHKTLRSNSATSSPTRGQKMPPSHRKSSEKVPTSYLKTHRRHSTGSSPTRSQEMTPPSHTIVLTRYPTASPKIPVKPTIGTTSHQTLSSCRSYPSSTKTPKSLSPPATTANPSTTQHSTGNTTLVSASRTLTVSNGQTASAQVGWLVVGVGIGGAVDVGGSTFPVPGGTEVIINGEDEAVTIETTTTPTTRSTSSSTTSSSSSTASPTPYNIYPNPQSTRPQQSAFTRDLERIAQPGSVKSITGGLNKLLLWVASLTPAQASELSRNPVVRALNADGSFQVNFERASATGTPPSPRCTPENCSLRKRDGTIELQQDARNELKMFSQASDDAKVSELPGYAYDSTGGRGITVYIIDTGIKPDHPEFRRMQGSIRWLYLPNEPEIENDEVGHGTCVASKVSGPTFGVAKSANIVLVKIYPINGSIHVSRYIAAWGLIARDITSKNLQGKAVVCTALNMNPNAARITENDKKTFIASIRDVIALDAAVVTSAGNINDRLPGFELATWPPLLASQLPIVVVGAVDTSGIYAPYSQGLPDELTVTAVGRVVCASARGGATEWQGTSFAAPAVAGLAAYLMSLDKYSVRLQVPGSVAKNVRDLIRSLAYERLPFQPVVAWNGIDSRQVHCPVRRDTESSGCPARNTTLPNAPPVIPISNPSPPSTATGTSTSTVASSSSSPTSSTLTASSISSIASDSSTTTSSHGGGGESVTATLTISLGGSTEIVTISRISDSVVVTNAPQNLAHRSLQ